MQYVRIERTKDGYSIDPTPYIEQLPRLAKSLPPGARSFATDPQHYAFHSQRCVKNLKPQRLVSGNSNGVNWLELQLQQSCWRHEEDLVIRYHDVRTVTVNPQRDALDVAGLDDVILDEILPHEHGCTHEIACLSGSLVISCGDLVASWVYADCPERQPKS